MPSIVHVVVTGNLAGVERYVCNVATELAGRDWEVSVVGGDPTQMPGILGSRVLWRPGANPTAAFHSLVRLGTQDICHVHMTIAEMVAVAARPLHRAPIVSTRHFAAHRGSALVTRALAPIISAGLTREIAASEFIARSVERHPHAVLVNGVPTSPCLWKPSSRVVLVLQRLEREKDTLTALRAWQNARMWEEGWSMRVAGDGSQRQILESWTASQGLEGVVFAGWATDVSSELASAGVLFAPAPREPVGLAVLEAMAAGIPVVACAGGGHMETVGRLAEAPMFPPSNAEKAAAALRMLLPDDVRGKVSAAGRDLAETHFPITLHVDRLLAEYEAARSAGSAPPRTRRTSRRAVANEDARRGFGAGRSDGSPDGGLQALVVCSLETWDEVWRRNQFFTDILMRRNPGLHVLFVEPPADPLFDLASRRTPAWPRLRSIVPNGRLRAFRPLKLLPRRAGPFADVLIRLQVLLAARLLGYEHPTLWINDVTYAPLIRSTQWPTVYDITDDWLAAPFTRRELDRLEELEQFALENAEAVVVCSPALEASRGRNRPVVVISNAVDAGHFGRLRLRPDDLPESPVAVYVGSIHEARIDISLVIALARALPSLNVVLVGPDSLDRRTRRQLVAEPNVFLLGARPYADVPAYLQHSDVIVIPHHVDEFTESLDPIKAYECLASGTPTVATPIAGFRNLEPMVTLAARESFAEAVESVLAASRPRQPATALPSWEDRAEEFERVLLRARCGRV